MLGGQVYYLPNKQECLLISPILTIGQVNKPALPAFLPAQ